MFGFGFTKLLVLAAIIGAVWYGYKWVGRLDRMAKRKVERDSGAGDGRGKGVDGPEEMIACRACGVYVAAQGAQSCGRDDCPYPA